MALDSNAPDINAPTPADTAPAKAPNVGAPDSPASISFTNDGQPTPPPRETFGQGIARGLTGEQYRVTGTGEVENARTTRPSLKGTLGSILVGATLGALHGATAARPGGIPSHEIGGGAGAGAAAADKFFQERDDRNKAMAQQNFTNRMAQQKAPNEDMQAKAEISRLNAMTGQIVQATKFEAENHPYELQLKKAGLDESALRMQELRQNLVKGSLELFQGLAANGIDPSTMLNTWQDAQAHAESLGGGESLALPNGVHGGEDHGAGVFDPRQLNTPLVKDVTVTSYKVGKGGKLTPQEHTFKAGTSTMDYVRFAMQTNFETTQLMHKIGADAELELKKSETYKNYQEGKKAAQSGGAKLVYAYNNQTKQSEAVTMEQLNANPGVYRLQNAKPNIDKDTEAIAQFRDAQMNLSRARAAMSAYQNLSKEDAGNVSALLGEDKLKAGFFGIEAPVDWINKNIDAHSWSQLSPQARNAIIGTLGLKIGIIAYNKALNKMGRPSDKTLMMEEKLAADPLMDPKTRAQLLERLQQNIDVATKDLPRIPGVDLPSDTRKQVEDEAARQQGQTQNQAPPQDLQLFNHETGTVVPAHKAPLWLRLRHGLKQLEGQP